MGYTFTTTVVMVMLLRDFAPYGKIKLNTLIRQPTTLLLVIKDEALYVSAVNWPDSFVLMFVTLSEYISYSLISNRMHLFKTYGKKIFLLYFYYFTFVRILDG
jgi:hypothetical protein